MQEARAEANAVDQQRQVARFDEALLDEEAAKHPGVAAELAPLEGFARARLDDLDAGDRFFGDRVHLAELVALAISDRVQLARIEAHGDVIGEDEQQRHEQKL